jgi:hypothetical protein
MGIYLTILYARHRPVRLALDPTFHQLTQERRNLETTIASERQHLGEANGNLVRLENQLDALIAYGRSVFHRERAHRKDQTEKRQVILDQLSEHVRSHLETTNSGTCSPSVSAPLQKNGD